MKLLIVFTLSLISLTGFAQTDTTIKGVRISFAYSPSVFPVSWQADPINARGEKLSSSEAKRSKQVILRALNKYPAAALSKDLKYVYFLKSMTFYDVGYGGTNSTDALYLTNSGEALGYTNQYLEQTFHHEYSSILYRNYPSYLNETEWKKANLEGFDYNDPENGVGAIRNNQSSQDLDTVLCKRGFLTQYSLSGLENDINTFAQNLFSPSEGFWELADRYPRIKRKMKLLVDFYHRIDPLFTEEYFRREGSVRRDP